MRCELWTCTSYTPFVACNQHQGDHSHLCTSGQPPFAVVPPEQSSTPLFVSFKTQEHCSRPHSTPINPPTQQQKLHWAAPSGMTTKETPILLSRWVHSLTHTTSVAVHVAKQMLQLCTKDPTMSGSVCGVKKQMHFYLRLQKKSQHLTQPVHDPCIHSVHMSNVFV